jgi:nucleoside-diphosphate-sugar epimerase
MKPMPESLKNARAIVTGGLGFIGSNLVLALLQEGAEVTVIDPCISGCGGNPNNLGDRLDRVDWLLCDIGHPEVLEGAIREADIVFNLAGEIRHQHSMVDPERDLDLNARSQLQFLQACARWNPGIRVIYAGTRQVYGVPRYLPVDENHPVDPVDFNGVHKQTAAAYHQLLSRHGMIDACVLHLSNVYGPRMAVDVPGQGFLGAFVSCLRDGSTITVFGNGRQLRDPIYVDDAVNAFLLAAKAPRLTSRVYNLGGPVALTLFDIASKASVAAGGACPRLRPFPEEQQQIDIGDYHANTARIRLELGWVPGVNFDAGIRRTLDAYGLVAATMAEWVTAS